jgi:hypothetical protein
MKSGPLKRARPLGGQSGILVIVATISLILPVVGVALLGWGGYRLAVSDPVGWWLLAAGGGIIAMDIVLDVMWAHPSLGASEEPGLSRPGTDLVGRTGIVTQPIVLGRGKVRLGDTEWIAEGVDQDVGSLVRVLAVKDVVVLVERV